MIFNYINSFNNIMHNIIENNKIGENKLAIDATLGNGYDTDFLKNQFEEVYSFDVQEAATSSYKEKNIANVNVILDSHEYFDKYITSKVDCIVYNLGYLPGANKHITTKTNSTIKSIESGLELLNTNGMMFIAMYPGHEEGAREKDSILNLAKNLNTKHFGVLYQEFINRPNNPPCLLVIEKK
ncbi:class I SAM-dependent methyltransferase [uncultured Clostridium sp.]|uniref:tRNA (mnm(5)s(2)U34)-methyltransferase n=1 Tax=uncultured Clostridium sp. TaxID=59620 RepID=UPI00262258A3|nr:class I SAM-dependent methyltransferase [uncultured Clostridium sp.]